MHTWLVCHTASDSRLVSQRVAQHEASDNVSRTGSASFNAYDYWWYCDVTRGKLCSTHWDVTLVHAMPSPVVIMPELLYLLFFVSRYIVITWVRRAQFRIRKETAQDMHIHILFIFKRGWPNTNVRTTNYNFQKSSWLWFMVYISGTFAISRIPSIFRYREIGNRLAEWCKCIPSAQCGENMALAHCASY